MGKNTFSAGAVIVRKEKEEFEFLLLRCFNYWDFPKGQVLANEDPLEGAKREVFEETNLQNLLPNWGLNYFQTAPYAFGKVARYYLFEVSPSSKVELLPNPETGIIEHHDYQWLSFSEAKEKLVPRVKEVLVWAQKTMKA